MNILLIAYSCEPDKGSEPGVGWNWANQIAARGHNVWVLTRANNRAVIEKTFYDKSRLVFLYYDLPGPILKFKKTIGATLYYAIWLKCIVSFCIKENRKIKFDLIHHITFGVFRIINPLPFFLNAPFVFGPVGGGETAPKELRKSFSVKNYIIDLIRDYINVVTFYNPFFRLFLSKTKLILSKTNETLNFLPVRYQSKTFTKIEIGIDNVMCVNDVILSEHKGPQILFVGRFLYWKAPHIVLRSFKKIHAKFPNAKLTMIGGGPELKALKELEQSLNIEAIKWIKWIPQNELKEYYKNSDVFIFPSLHDSSGNVVLEALSFGLPVVCLNIGGPAIILGNNISTSINVQNLAEDEIIELITKKTIQIISDSNYKETLSKQALKRASELSWKNTVDRVYSIIESTELK